MDKPAAKEKPEWDLYCKKIEVIEAEALAAGKERQRRLAIRVAGVAVGVALLGGLVWWKRNKG